MRLFVTLFIVISHSILSLGQPFSEKTNDPFGLSSFGAYPQPAFGDLDGDGDEDLLAGGFGFFQYQENGLNGGEELSFEGPDVNPFGLSPNDEFAILHPALVDIDADGDLDLFSGEDTYIAFYENIGTATEPQFDAPVRSPFGLQEAGVSYYPAFGDIDNDGDLDLFVGEFLTGVQWAENTGTATAPQFAPLIAQPMGFQPMTSGFFPDLGDWDQDGDLDLIVGEDNGNFLYYENTGTDEQAEFSSPVQNPFELSGAGSMVNPVSVDIDGDGDLDLVGGVQGAGSYAFYENEGGGSVPVDPVVIASLTSQKNEAFVFGPNPCQGQLWVKGGEMNFEVVALTGEQMLKGKVNNQWIDVQSLPSGVYFLIFESEKDKGVRRFVKE